MAKDIAVDFSALDPDSVATSSTPRMPKPIANDAQKSYRTTMQVSGEEEDDNGSVYSLHLSALGPLSPISTLQDDHELRAELEEPGGPSDFTQNMFDWINGPTEKNTEPRNVPVAEAPYKSPLSVIHDHNAQLEDLSGDNEEETLGEEQPAAATPKHAARSGEKKHLLDMNAEEVEEKFAKLQAKCDELQGMWDHLNARFQKPKSDNANGTHVRTPQSKEISRHYQDKQISASEQRRVFAPEQSPAVWQEEKLFAKDATINAQQDEISHLKQQLKNEQALRRKERDAATHREAELVRSYEGMMQQLKDSRVVRRASPVLQRSKNLIDNAITSHDANAAPRRTSLPSYHNKTAGVGSRDEHTDEITVQSPKAFSIKDAGREAKTQTIPDAKTAQLEQTVQHLQSRLSTEAEKHAAELVALKAEYDAVANDVDQWMIEQVEERQRKTDASAVKKDKKISSLKTKVEELESLNARYEKELMLSWGREEFGRAPPGEKQRYRYRYT